MDALGPRVTQSVPVQTLGGFGFSPGGSFGFGPPVPPYGTTSRGRSSSPRFRSAPALNAALPVAREVRPATVTFDPVVQRSYPLSSSSTASTPTVATSLPVSGGSARFPVAQTFPVPIPSVASVPSMRSVPSMPTVPRTLPPFTSGALPPSQVLPGSRVLSRSLTPERSVVVPPSFAEMKPLAAPWSMELRTEAPRNSYGELQCYHPWQMRQPETDPRYAGIQEAPPCPFWVAAGTPAARLEPTWIDGEWHLVAPVDFKGLDQMPKQWRHDQLGVVDDAVRQLEAKNQLPPLPPPRHWKEHKDCPIA